MKRRFLSSEFTSDWEAATVKREKREQAWIDPLKQGFVICTDKEPFEVWRHTLYVSSVKFQIQQLFELLAIRNYH